MKSKLRLEEEQWCPPLKLRFCILDHLTWLFWQQEFKLPTRVRNNLVGYQLVLKGLWQVMMMMGTYVGREGEGGALLKAELAAKALEGCKIMMVFRHSPPHSPNVLSPYKVDEKLLG
jgi:hypothetical protein